MAPATSLHPYTVEAWTHTHTHTVTFGMLVFVSIIQFQSFPLRLCASRYFLTKARLSALVPPLSWLRAPWVMMPRTTFTRPRSTCSHSSPARGCVGWGNQPDLLATSRAALGTQWSSRAEEAEIWESGRWPESMPCSSEHGASEEEREMGGMKRRKKYE